MTEHAESMAPHCDLQRPGGPRGWRKPARIAAMLVFALAAAGCPADRGTGDTIAADPEPDPTPVVEDQEADPAGQWVNLDPRPGYTLAGTAAITRWGPETRIVVSVQAAPPDAVLPVRVHTGQCEDEAAERAALEPVRTDSFGVGRSESTVPLPIHEILTGQHYLQVYEARGELHQGLACGNIPARPDLHPGIAPP
jgi:hypothetical protein